MKQLLVAPVMVVLCGCQPMYGAKAQRLRTPDPVKPPKDLPTEVAAKPIYIDECEVRTSPAKPKPDPKQATVLTRTAQTKLSTADQAPPSEETGALIADGIADLSSALVKDPFNAEATLELARAYDRVLRKGCALAMLTRLGRLAENPKVSPQAPNAVEDVANNRTWFGGYRNEALEAVGR